MWPAPRSVSYALPAKYGGDVTTSATELSSTSAMSRASPQITESAAPHGLTVSSFDRSGRGEARVEIAGVVTLAVPRSERPRARRHGRGTVPEGSAGCGSPAAMADPEPRPGRQHDGHDRDHHAHGRAGVPTRAAPRAQGDGIAGASGLPLPGRAVAAGTAGRAGGGGRARLGARSALAILGGRRRGGGGRARRGGTAVRSTGRRRGRPGRRARGARSRAARSGAGWWVAAHSSPPSRRRRSRARPRCRTASPRPTRRPRWSCRHRRASTSSLPRRARRGSTPSTGHQDR